MKSAGQLIRVHPVLILLILSSFPWLFSIYQSGAPAGMLDPFIYTGHFLNKELLVKQFDYGPYYFARISWILIGDAFYKVLNENIAGLALRLLLSFAVSSGFYKTLRLLQSDSRYIFPITVLSCVPVWHPDFAMTIFWDYPDGPAICYAVWGFFFLLNHRIKDFYRFLIAGVLFVLAGCTNLIVGFVIASGLISYAVVYRPDRRRYFAGLLFGFLVTNGLLLILGRVFYGDALIYLYQWKQVDRVITDPEYLVNMWGQGVGFLVSHNRYVTYAAVLAISSAILLRYGNKTELKFIRMMYFTFILSLLLHAVMDLVFQKAIFRVFYHVSYVLLPMHLLLSGILLELFSADTAKWRTSAAFWMTIVLAAGAILAACKFVSPFLQISGFTNWILLGIYLAVCLSLLSVPMKFKRLTILMLLFLPAIFSFLQQSRPGFHRYAGYSIFNEKNAACMRSILRLSNVLSFLGLKEKLAFVYAEHEEPLPLFDSLAATFGGWHSPTRTYQEFLQAPNKDHLWLYTSRTVIHMATNVEELARQRQEFEKRGFRPQNVAAFQLPSENKTILLKLTKYRFVRGSSAGESPEPFIAK